MWKNDFRRLSNKHVSWVPPLMRPADWKLAIDGVVVRWKLVRLWWWDKSGEQAVYTRRRDVTVAVERGRGGWVGGTDRQTSRRCEF